MKTYGIAPPFLTSTLDKSEWSASRPCRVTPGKTEAGTHCIEGWVGHRVGLEVIGRRKIYLPCQKCNPDSSVVRPVSLVAIPTLSEDTFCV
jgi:hypothetical protein